MFNGGFGFKPKFRINLPRSTIESSIERLKRLTEFGNLADLRYFDIDLQDPIYQLSPSRLAGWKKIISSVATTEAIEQTLINPLFSAFKNRPEVLEYLGSHHLDEFRHSDILNRYLKITFNHIKIKRTVSDYFIYDTLIPLLSKLFVRKPLYSLSMILFFESYGIGFYRQFRYQAEIDGLQSLSQILNQIQKDENRHLIGIETLVSLFQMENGKPHWFDLVMIRTCLSLLVLDVNMGKVHFYNRSVRDHILKLGMNPEILTMEARKSAHKAYGRIGGSYVRP